MEFYILGIPLSKFRGVFQRKKKKSSAHTAEKKEKKRVPSELRKHENSREEQKQEEQKQRTENHSSVPSSTGNSYHYGTTHQQETQTYHETLRDWYDSPEDLYEDGGYDDLDEAYDEWEDDD